MFEYSLAPAQQISDAWAYIDRGKAEPVHISDPELMLIGVGTTNKNLGSLYFKDSVTGSIPIARWPTVYSSFLQAVAGRFTDSDSGSGSGSSPPADPRSGRCRTAQKRGYRLHL